MRRVTIPAQWTGEQALSVVAFLEDVIRAIWRQHGDHMAHLLNPDREPQPELRPSSPIDEDLPF